MLTSLLAQYGKWLVLLGIILFVIAVFNAIRAGRNARQAYYAVRRDALMRTRRWALSAVLIAMATSLLVVFSFQQPGITDAVASVTTTPTPPIASIATKLLPTQQPTRVTAAHMPTFTPTPIPSQTPTLVPTPTPLPALPGILLTPVPSAVPPAANASLKFTTLASIIQNNAPVDPGLAFPGGTRTVRLFFQASGVNSGAVWSVLCYKGDQLVDSVVTLWKWGTRTQTARAFCGLDGSPGKYRIEAYLGPTRQFAVNFELLAPTPTPTPSG